MITFQVIAIILILSFVAWLFFTNKKKIKKPRYTKTNGKNSLTNIDKMLGNVTQKVDNNTVEEVEKKEEVPKEIAKRDKSEQQETNNKEISKTSQFDLKNAVIGSVILNKNKKK